MADHTSLEARCSRALSRKQAKKSSLSSDHSSHVMTVSKMAFKTPYQHKSLQLICFFLHGWSAFLSANSLPERNPIPSAAMGGCAEGSGLEVSLVLSGHVVA